MSKTVPETKQQVAYLREKAARFRAMAPMCDPMATAKLLALSVELEAKAAEIDTRIRQSTER